MEFIKNSIPVNIFYYVFICIKWSKAKLKAILSSFSMVPSGGVKHYYVSNISNNFFIFF